MTRKSSYEVFSLTFRRMKFRATKYPETASLFAPYDFFHLHQDIFLSEGRVWNLFG